MTWTTHYLKLPDESAWLSAVPEGWQKAEDGPYYTAEGVFVDVVGDVSSPAVLDEDGNTVTPARHVDGYHVNIRLKWMDMPESLAPYEIAAPQFPKRVFA